MLGLNSTFFIKKIPIMKYLAQTVQTDIPQYDRCKTKQINPSMASFLGDMSKECKLKSDERGVWCESPLFAYRNSFHN